MNLGPGRAAFLAMLLAGAASGEPLFVADPDANRVVLLETADGSETLVSEGGLFRYPTGVARHPDGALYHYDRGSGRATLRSQDGDFRWPAGLGLRPDGDAVVADPVARALVRVDGAGVQTLVHAGGPPLFPSGADTAPLAVPALGPLALVALSLLFAGLAHVARGLSRQRLAAQSD